MIAHGNNNRIFRKIGLYCTCLATVLALAIFAYVLIGSTVRAADSDLVIPPGESQHLRTLSTKASIPAEEPARLRIPTLSIDAKVQKTGITKKGTMGTPTNFTDVAWYQYGPMPGQKGTAVIDGHVDNGLALAGVFKHLSDLKKGHEIEIITKNGTRVAFKVMSVETYDYKSVPAEKIFVDDGPPRLVLITCGGTWVPGEKTYDKRVIVTATLMDQ